MPWLSAFTYGSIRNNVCMAEQHGRSHSARTMFVKEASDEDLLLLYPFLQDYDRLRTNPTRTAELYV